MADELTAMWGNFSLLEEENLGVSVESTEIVPLESRGKDCLVGKLISDRIVPKEFLRVPLIRAWRPKGNVKFSMLGENKFVVEFESSGDKARVMAGRPWLFDGNLVSLADFDGLRPPSEWSFGHESFWVRMYNLPLACMGKAMGWKIGSTVGKVEEVDVDDEEAGWGEYLRVKINMDLSKPLARGRLLHLQSGSTWVGFKYEKLPKFCFQCGVICHGRHGCIRIGEKMQGSKGGETPYGHWLRVNFPMRKGLGGGFKEGSHHEDTCSGTRKRPATNQKADSLSSEGDESTGAASMHTLRNSNPLITEKVNMETTPTLRSNNEGQQMKNENWRGNVRKETRNKGKKARVGGKELKTTVWKVVEKDVSNHSEQLGSRDQHSKNVSMGNMGSAATYPNQLVSKTSIPVLAKGETSGKTPTKYLGQWDAALGCMVWESVEEELLDLAKDPITGNYFPRVVKPTGNLSTTAPKSGLSPSTSKVLANSGPPKTEFKQNVITPGVYTRWKKRARQLQSSNNQACFDGPVEGKQKAQSRASGGDDHPSKKGRKMVEVGQTPSLRVQAVAANQPRLSK
jgi:hypothetical protein